MTPKRLLCCLLLPLLWACEDRTDPGLYNVQPDGTVVYSGELGSDVTMVIASDPPSLHPTNARTNYRDLILGLVQQRLHTIDIVNPGTVAPELADGPIIRGKDPNTMYVDVHEAATWADGTPITAEDVLFTFKVVACPLVENAGQKSYLEFLQDVQLIAGQPRRVELTFREYYMNNQYVSVLSTLLDARTYDPEGVLEDYAVADFLTNDAEAYAEDQTLSDWASFFNDPKKGRDLEWLNAGSGPYRISEWVPEQRIVLERRERYWGDDLPGILNRAYPPRITFRIIRDAAALELQMRDQQVDVAVLSTEGYSSLLSDSSVVANYHLERQPRTSVAFVAWNLRPEVSGRLPIFSDQRVRQAMAHAIPLSEMLEEYFPLEQTQSVSTVPPMLPDHNDDIEAFPYDPVKADSLLTAAGWVDSDGDQIREKIVNGVEEELRFELLFPPNSQSIIDLMDRMAVELERVGVGMTPAPGALREYLPQVFSYDYDAAVMGLSSSPLAYDFKQLFHSDAWLDQGSNFFGYSNSQVDEWIDQARVETDPATRKDLVDKIQATIYAEQPAFFLYHPRTELGVHRRFTGAERYPVNPHVFLNNFQLVTE